MKTETIGENLFWCYANLAMAHSAVEAGAIRYGPTHYMVRSRLWAGLKSGQMDIGALADDEELKMRLPQACAYCGSRECLSVDHLVAIHHGGANSGENMVWACRACNSSKGTRDALAWLQSKGRFPPLLLLRRYLKLALDYFRAHNALNDPFPGDPALPFDLKALPRRFPPPSELTLWVVASEEDLEAN